MEKEHLKLQKNHNIKTKQLLDTLFIDNKTKGKKSRKFRNQAKLD